MRRSCLDLPEGLFVLLSGENPPLGLAEFKAACEAEGAGLEIIEDSGNVVRVKCESDLAIRAARRCSLLKSLCKEVAHLPASPHEAMPMVNGMAIDVPQSPFLVRVQRIGGAGKPSDTPAWERILGERLHLVTGASVDAENPRTVFQLVVSFRGAILGEMLWSPKRGRFLNRSPKRRPFTHPSNLTPQLAICMLNMARVREGQIVLDPFCGVGSTLMECHLLGGRPIGIDIAERMVRGSMRNLRWVGATQRGLILGDARNLPIREVDAIVTDPPYGRLSSTHGERAEALFSALLSGASEILRRDGFLVTLSPLNIGIEEMAGKAGLEFEESYPILITKRLIRELAVFRR